MIRLKRGHLIVAAQTHPGRSGKENEDRFAVSAYRVSAIDPTPALFAVVADGIGGHRSGEMAADLAVEHISQVISNSDGFEPLATLEQAVRAASRLILKKANESEKLAGMGTTCACAWVIGLRLYIAAVGDSRIYLVRDHVIHQLTTDHTWIQEAIEKGILIPGETADNPNVHVIRRYLGSPQPPEVDLRLRLKKNDTDAQAAANQGLLLRAGDRLLLCSDGLTDEINDADILRILDDTMLNGSQKQLLSAVRKMVAIANQHGGRDNITAVLLQVPGVAAQPGRQKWIWTALIIIVFLLALLAACVLSIFSVVRLFLP